MILITGATGKNGREILERLSARHERVRAMIRPGTVLPNTKSSPALECVEADFNDPPSLRQALNGVQRAFLVTNSSQQVEQQQLRFITLARETGVRHIVYLSQLHASLESPLRFLRYHAAVEAAIRESGMSFTLLRPNLYMQGLLMIGQTIASEGKFYVPADDARVSVVDVRDVAAVAVAALTQKQHEGKTYNITGPQALTHAEMAEELSSAIGRPVRFVDVPERTFLESLLSFHTPAWQAEGLIEDYAHYRRGEAADVSSAVVEVTGEPPHSFAQFAQDYRSAFLQSSKHASLPVA